MMKSKVNKTIQKKTGLPLVIEKMEGVYYLCSALDAPDSVIDMLSKKSQTCLHATSLNQLTLSQWVEAAQGILKD